MNSIAIGPCGRSGPLRGATPIPLARQPTRARSPGWKRRRSSARDAQSAQTTGMRSKGRPTCRTRPSRSDSAPAGVAVSGAGRPGAGAGCAGVGRRAALGRKLTDLSTERCSHGIRRPKGAQSRDRVAWKVSGGLSDENR